MRGPSPVSPIQPFPPPDKSKLQRSIAHLANMKISARQNTRSSLPVVCGALLAALTAASFAHAQTPVTTWAQSYGVGSYDANGQPVDANDQGTGADLPNGIAPMPDGGVVVGGQLGLFKYIAPFYNATGGALVRYDGNGNIVWQTLLRQDNDNSGHLAGSEVDFVRTDAAGNIFVAGGNGNGSGNGAQTPFVAKFAPDGTKVWQSGASVISFIIGTDDSGKPILQDGGVGLPTSMQLTPDGGVVVGGSVYAQGTSRGGNGTIYPMLTKFNADGSLGFHREYVNNLQYSDVRSMCPSADGQGYALLLSVDGSTTTTQGGWTVVITDAAGNPTSQRTFADTDCSFITRDTSGGYFVLGTKYSGTEVRKLHADLTPVWQKVLDFPQPTNGLKLAPTLLPLAGGGCLIGGQAGAPPKYSVYNALLLTLDGTGALTSAHVLGGQAGGEGLSGNAGYVGRPLTACLTTDGGIAFTISSFDYATGSQTKADWWVVKADANGKVIGFPDNMADYPLSSFLQSDSTEAASYLSNDYGPAPTNEAHQLVLAPEPAFILENLATETGINLPTVKFQANPATSYNHPVFFGGEAYLGQGAYYLKFSTGHPFGYYGYLSDPNYLFHEDLGYEYVFDANDAAHGVFLYDFTTKGFFYTSPVFPFPYLYDFQENSVVYYYPSPNDPDHYNTNGYRFFYVFNTGQIISK